MPLVDLRRTTRLLLAAAIWALGNTQLAIAQPSLTKLMPMGVAPGKTTEIRLEGAKLSGPLTAWTSFSAWREMPSADPKQNSDGKTAVCKLSLSGNVPVGIGGIVVATPEGASDVMYVMVDDLPTIVDGGKNHELALAQQVLLPAAIEGESDGTLADYYRLNLVRGQQLSVEVVAARLGQDFDAVVRILDDAGNELLLSDDDPASGADTRFAFVAPKDGSYLVELRDNRYKAGGRYRLRLGRFPLVSTTFPPVVERDAVTQLQFRGPEPIAGAPILAAALGTAQAGAALNLGLKLPGCDSSAWAAPTVTDLRLAGTKPGPGERAVGVNRGASGAGLLPASEVDEAPCVFYGALEIGGERDVFAFKGLKGKPLRFKAISRSAGSAAIVALRILDASGKQLGESPVTESDEPVLAFTPPADGTYQLAVDELAGRYGNDFVYAVECELSPQFSLTLKNDKNNRLKYSLPSGGAFYLDVQCQRAGYDGPISLTIDSPHAGWQLVNSVIPAKANEARVYIQPPLDFAPGELATLRVVGKAEQAGHVMSAGMSTLVQLRAARPQTPYPPRWHDGLIAVSAQPAKAVFFQVTPKSMSLELPQGGGQAHLTLDFERTDAEFKDTPLVVVPIGLPAGVTAEVKRNGNGLKETYDIHLTGTKVVASGQHVFRYFAYAELGSAGRGVMSGDLLLNIINKPSASGGGEKSP